MANPKQRHTKSRRNKRRLNLALKQSQSASCPKCGVPILPHRACPNCGTYKGREVLDVLAKLDKKQKKLKKKELSQQEREQVKEKGLDAGELSKK